MNGPEKSEYAGFRPARRPRAWHQGQLDFFCAIYAVINALVLTHGINLSACRKLLADTLHTLSGHSFLWQAVLRNETDFYWLVDYMLAAFCQSGPLKTKTLAAKTGRAGGFQAKAFGPEHLKLEEVFLYRKDSKEGAAASPEDLWKRLKSWLPEEDPSIPPQPSPYDVESWFGQPDTGTGTGPNTRTDTGTGTGPNTRTGAGAGAGPERHARAAILRFNRYLPFSDQPIIAHWTAARAFEGDTLLLFDATADQGATHSIPLEQCALHKNQLSPTRQLEIELASIRLLEAVPYNAFFNTPQI